LIRQQQLERGREGAAAISASFDLGLIVCVSIYEEGSDRRERERERERERGQKNNRWSVMALLLNRAGRRAGNMLSTLLLRDAGTSRYLVAASIVQKEDNGGSFAKDFASAESSREASSPTAASRGHGHAFAASLVLGAAAFYSSLQQVVCSAFSISLSLRISRLT
jgi:hypothetical protein